MLYFSGPNQGRVHFYAQKNYFESQTPGFFIPFNQWVTVQVTLSQYDGYHIVMLDDQGEVLLSMSRDFNMRKQYPKPNVMLFKGFSGLASRFLLSNQKVDLPTANYFIAKKALCDFNFQDVSKDVIGNQGSGSILKLTSVPTPKTVPYQLYEYGQKQGSMLEDREFFDGITCDDRHMTVQLDNSTSQSIDFNLPYVNTTEEGNATTVQFWFKLTDKFFYEAAEIRKMQDIRIFEIQ